MMMCAGPALPCLQTYVALAGLDPDAAWCQLHAALLAVGGSPLPGLDAVGSGQSTPDQVPRVPPGVLLRGSGQQLDFPPAVQIAPSPPASAASGSSKASVVPPGLRECSAGKLAAMMRQVEQLPPRWHKQVEALLERQ
jgi:hypothetical protein